MFKTKNELIDYLLSSNFDNEYTILEYRYLLLAFQEHFRTIASKNSNLEKRIIEKDNEIKLSNITIENQKEFIKHIQNLNANLNLRKIPKKKWYQKLFNI